MSTLTVLQGIREQIMSRLRAELISGELRPGDMLREETLAARFGVSRMPVRQALQQLAGEGLLISRRNRGMAVSPPPSDSVRDLLLPMRVMVELYALRSCWDQLGERDYASWDSLLDELQLACARADYAAVHERDFAFHRAIVERSGLPDLLPVWTLLINQTQRFYRHATIARDELPSIHMVHAELLKVIRDRDWNQVESAVTEHIWDGPFNDRAKEKWRRQSRGMP